MGYAIALFGFNFLDPVPAVRTAAARADARRYGGLRSPLAGRQHESGGGRHESKLGEEEPGKPAAEILPAFGDLAARLGAGPGEPFEVTLGSGAGARTYEADLSPLRDFRDLLVGYRLMLRDVTEQKRAHAQIIEQQRSLAVLNERERLARELHDELGQVLGYVKMQAQATRNELAREQVATADEYLNQLVTVAQDAHDDVREYILGTKTTAGSQLEFLPALQAYLQQFAAHYGIRTELCGARTHFRRFRADGAGATAAHHPGGYDQRPQARARSVRTGALPARGLPGADRR